MKVTTTDDGLSFDKLTPADIKGGVKSGYLAFSIAGGSTLIKPMLAVKLETEDEPVVTGFSITASPRTFSIKLNASQVVTLTANNAIGSVDYTVSPTYSWVTFDKETSQDATLLVEPVSSDLVRSTAYTLTVNATDNGRTVSKDATPVTISITVTSEDVPHHGTLGSSGGGCSAAGFGALALALLGGLIARKK